MRMLSAQIPKFYKAKRCYPTRSARQETGHETPAPETSIFEVKHYLRTKPSDEDKE